MDTMMRTHLRRLAAVVSLFLFGAIAIPRAQLFDSIDDVIFYPAYGVQDAASRVWEIHMRIKVQEPRSLDHITRLFQKLPPRGEAEDSRFRARIADFVADDKSREKVKFRFDGDASGKEYRLEDGSGDALETNRDGVVQGTIRLTDTDAQRLLAAQSSTSGWLSYKATSSGHAGAGRMRLLGPTGVSVISDIDDTIKITEVPAGKTTVVVNTFYREFVPAKEMIEKYHGFGDAAFHYVSGGPWQLYRPVASFLIDGGLFPAGSFHMKDLSGNIGAPISSLVSLERFVATGSTVNHKVGSIETIMGHFPSRTFILIGDSGECDPEVYQKVKGGVHGAKVQEIIIRDVVNARERNPSRLQGMTILAAATIVDGGPPPSCGE